MKEITDAMLTTPLDQLDLSVEYYDYITTYPEIMKLQDEIAALPNNTQSLTYIKKCTECAALMKCYAQYVETISLLILNKIQVNACEGLDSLCINAQFR